MRVRDLIGFCIQNENHAMAVLIRKILVGPNCLPYRPYTLLGFSLASCSVCAWSQTQLATVFGAINDPTGAVVPGAGFQTQIRQGVELTSASEVMMNLLLATGTPREQVTVSTGVTAIDNATSTVGGLISEHSLTELPINGRDLFNAAILQPAVAPPPGRAPSLPSNGEAPHTRAV